jgi:hypothetical protein
MVVEGGGRLSECAATVIDLEERKTGLIDEQMVEGGRGVGDDAESAGGKSFFDVTIAVGRAAPHGDEDGAGTDSAGVVFNASDGLVGCARGVGCGDFVDQVFPIHLDVDCRLRSSPVTVTNPEFAH